MTTTQQVPVRNLTQEAVESIERIIWKSGDDLAVSVARSFERLEERIDGAESRLYSRFADLEDKLEKVEEVFTAQGGRKALPRASEQANAPK
jgi:phage shock protein A